MYWFDSKFDSRDTQAGREDFLRMWNGVTCKHGAAVKLLGKKDIVNGSIVYHKLGCELRGVLAESVSSHVYGPRCKVLSVSHTRSSSQF